MTSKKPAKPELHKKKPPEPERPPEGDSEEYRAFDDFARKVMQVPKPEIDAEEKKWKKEK